jgi:hypothetical protein
MIYGPRKACHLEYLGIGIQEAVVQALKVNAYITLRVKHSLDQWMSSLPGCSN